jgi:hypothetical protein
MKNYEEEFTTNRRSNTDLLIRNLHLSLRKNGKKGKEKKSWFFH